MVEVVGPLGVDPEPADLPGADDPRVVQVALGDQDQVTPEVGLQDVDLGGQLLQEGDGGGVDDGVDGVEPEAVEMVVAEPHQGVVAEVAADLVAVRPVEVQSVAPRGLVAIGEVRPELRQVVARRPEVVVDHVEDRAEPARVAGIDQTLEPVGTAVDVPGREQVDPVVAPAEPAGELGHRHDLDVGHAQRLEVIEPLDGGFEGPLAR